MLTCTQCGGSNPDGSRFCNHCGSRIEAGAAVPAAGRVRPYTPRHLVDQVLKTRAALQGERKRVTVLFADIKGSTELAEQAGEEAWHDILDRYFAILGAAVHRYEGTINQYTGDGVMALFGAPVAHEDHAQRACHAALEMQRELRNYANELRLNLGLNLTLRIGLNTGDVIVGSIGDDLRMDYTAQGLTVNLAARMEHICEPGRIYCTRATAALVEGYFRLHDIGAMAVEGVSAPVRVYEVEAAGSIQTRLDRALARGVARFIGRERELQRLHQALERAREEGQGNIVVVTGGPGFGKSRLCHEFALACERRGVAVHRATGVPYASALPLHPLLALTRSRLGIAPGASPADARRLAAGGLLLFDPQAAVLLPQMLEFLDIDDGALRTPGAAPDRSSLQRFLARFLAHANEPQILLVEDLHFADAGTEAMLDALCGELAGSRTLLLLNFRPDYADGWLQARPHERVPLAVLDDTQIETLAAELLGDDPSLAGLARRLGVRAAGNPFFVEEAIQALQESEHLQGARSAYRLLRPIEDEWPIPDTVQALVAARIDRLDDNGKHLLQTAAVIGQDFDTTTLARLSGVAIEDCREALSVAARKGFFCPRVDASGYVFSHPLIQDVAYRTQLERARAATHARLAALLEEAHPLTALPSEAAVGIAHHWRHAAAWERAARWNLQAALWRSTQDAPTTHKQYQLALEHAHRAPASPAVDRLRIMALAGLLRMATFTGLSGEEVDRIYREARTLAEALGDTAVLAEVLICWSMEQLHRGDAAEAMRIAEEFVERALAADARDLVRRYRLALLLTCATAGEPRAGVALIAKGDGSDWLTAQVSEDNYMSRGFYSLLQSWSGHLAAGREHLHAVLAYAEREQRAASWMYASRVDLAWMSGNHAGVLAQAQIALQRAEAYGSPYFRAVALRALGFAHVLQGDPASAIPLLEQLRPLIAKGGSAHQFEAHSLATLARAYGAAGRLQEAFDHARAAIASGQHSRSRLWEIAAWLALFEIPGEGPWTALAEEGVHRVDALITATGADSARPWWWLARSRLAHSESERAGYRARAIEAFARIGADGHVQRLSAVAG